ncbi:hypothetical protein PoB_001503000 [Plakobranchus ocellatus]|uniref:Uncharacterized protein n=1 Tax=Plakobranchus ocellatus TaxID=259542 RepID=A0AAV3Z1J4_9GAST|nr:hypothetical protein PoB_001503000 [Plakobranchus ocellatus]
MRNKTGLVVRTATVSRIMRGNVMALHFPLSDRASDVRPGCKTQRIAPTLRQVADLMCARIKEREYFKTCIVGHVNCCLQCAPTLFNCSVGLQSLEFGVSVTGESREKIRLTYPQETFKEHKGVGQNQRIYLAVITAKSTATHLFILKKEECSLNLHSTQKKIDSHEVDSNEDDCSSFRGDSPDNHPRPFATLHAMTFLVPQTVGDSLDS